MKISGRGAVSPFLIMEAFREANDLARAGSDVIHLSLGQPGREVPQKVLERLGEKMKTAKLGYTDAAGVPELRKRIVRHYEENYGLEIPIERVFVTIGSSSAFFLSLLSVFDHADQVAITLPCYPAYPNVMEALGLRPVFLRGTEENRFQPTVEMLAALPEKPDGLIIASPSNPTGTIIHEKEMAALVRYCEEQKIRLISDEIYHGITYGETVSTALAHSEQAIVVNSFSKYFLMPGWRLGWAVIPQNLTRSFESLVQNFFISPSALAQYAALEVFDCKEELQAEVAAYARNREVLLRELPLAGFDHLVPAEGAFFIYANVSKLTDDSVAFCRDMLYDTGVVAVSGKDFDRQEGSHYVRFSFSGSEANMIEAMRRLKEWMRKRYPHLAA